MSNSFDLVTQRTYDLFSHSKYIQLCNLGLEYLCDHGHIQLSALQISDQKSYIQVLLKTKPGMLYVYELQGKIENPDRSATIYVEDVKSGCSLLNCTYKINDSVEVDEHHGENSNHGIKVCRKYICKGFENFDIYFRAKSNLTALGIFFKDPYTDLVIRQFNVSKLDSCVNNASCTSTLQHGTDSDSTSYYSDYGDYPLEQCPICPTHGQDCPTRDPAKHGNPEICPTHGLNCPTFESFFTGKWIPKVSISPKNL